MTGNSLKSRQHDWFMRIWLNRFHSLQFRFWILLFKFSESNEVLSTHIFNFTDFYIFLLCSCLYRAVFNFCNNVCSTFNSLVEPHFMFLTYTLSNLCTCWMPFIHFATAKLIDIFWMVIKKSIKRKRPRTWGLLLSQFKRSKWNLRVPSQRKHSIDKNQPFDIEQSHFHLKRAIWNCKAAIDIVAHTHTHQSTQVIRSASKLKFHEIVQLEVVSLLKMCNSKTLMITSVQFAFNV